MPMTPAQEQILNEVHANTAATNATLEALVDRLKRHEEEDAEVHKDVSSLKTTRTQLMTIAKVAAVVGSAILSVLVWVASHVLAQ